MGETSAVRVEVLKRRDALLPASEHWEAKERGDVALVISLGVKDAAGHLDQHPATVQNISSQHAALAS